MKVANKERLAERALKKADEAIQREKTASQREKSLAIKPAQLMLKSKASYEEIQKEVLLPF